VPTCAAVALTRHNTITHFAAASISLRVHTGGTLTRPEMAHQCNRLASSRDRTRPLKKGIAVGRRCLHTASMVTRLLVRRGLPKDGSARLRW
jgi:hypothetical protein